MISNKKIAAGVFSICIKTGRILLIRRGLQQPSPGLWAGFGGKMEENDKTPKEAAIREFKEESQFKGTFKISTEPLYINRSNHSEFYTYIALFEEEFIPDLGPAQEAIDYGWFYLYEMPEALLPNFKIMLQDKDDYIKNVICSEVGICDTNEEKF